MSAAELVNVRVVDAKGLSVLVEFDRDGMPYRAYVDAEDLQPGGVPAERLEDAPYGVDWSSLDFAGMEREAERALKRAGIWTYDDLQCKDRAVIRIAVDLVGAAIWETAKRSCKEAKEQ